MNKLRKSIWEKSGGKCWYCGCDLPEKGWHIDHFEPIGRRPPEIKYVYSDDDGRINRKREEVKRFPSHPERDHIDNLVPACQSCNRIKGMNSIEGFRQQITRFVNSLNRYSIQYKFAKRYGLILETKNPVVFWFERMAPTTAHRSNESC
jgi:5-methylcytosine-specific restriction endonuclease McrA